MNTSLGLDLSTSATGIVLLGETGGNGPPLLLYEEEFKPKPHGLTGKREIAVKVMTTIRDKKPTIIVLEGYGLNLKNASSIVPLIELGGIVRLMLHLDGLAWYAPTPGECKKFSTGKGNSPKDIVMMHVYKRWQYEAKTNNLADAYVCAAMGLARLNAANAVTKDMQNVVSGMELFTN